MRKAQSALGKEFRRLVADHFIPAFAREKTGHRVVATLNAWLAMCGTRKTITNSRIIRGVQQQDWTADYRAFSVGKWDPVSLFAGVFRAAIPLLGREGPVVLGIDDTGFPKSGEEIEFGGWVHNPLLPPYVRPAIQWGVPVLHAALLIQGEVVHRPTAITVAFEPIPREKTKQRGTVPKKKAPGQPDGQAPLKRGRRTKEETLRRKAERNALIVDEKPEAKGCVQEVKLKATELAARVIWRVRRWMDAEGLADRTLLVVGDSSFTNATVLLCLPHHTLYVGRTRPDSKLQALGEPTRSGSHMYGPELPSPREMAMDRLLEAQAGRFHYAGAHRELRFLETGPLFRKTSTRKAPLKLLILEPVPYGRGKSKPKGYNKRAFLLTTALDTPPDVLIGAYLMRWELEVVHRIWKTDLGIGQAQVRKHRVPAAMAAYYALLVIANRIALGEERHPGFGPTPKWIAKRREYLEKEKVDQGKPKPRYRASPTEIKTLITRVLGTKWQPALPLVA
jgi:hypothetical protein